MIDRDELANIRAQNYVAQLHHPGNTPEQREQIDRVIAALPEPILEKLASAHTTVRALQRGERYADASPALKRLGVDVDGWPAPPAGLYVVEERTLYARSLSPMTIAHELGHAYDCALGGGVYASSTDPDLRRQFTGTMRFTSPYAATGTDEWFAEGFRCYVSQFTEANDPRSHWPKATIGRLNDCSPALKTYLDNTLERERTNDRALSALVDEPKAHTRSELSLTHADFDKLTLAYSNGNSEDFKLDPREDRALRFALRYVQQRAYELDQPYLGRELSHVASRPVVTREATDRAFGEIASKLSREESYALTAEGVAARDNATRNIVNLKRLEYEARFTQERLDRMTAREEMREKVIEHFRGRALGAHELGGGYYALEPGPEWEDTRDRPGWTVVRFDHPDARFALEDRWPVEEAARIVRLHGVEMPSWWSAHSQTAYRVGEDRSSYVVRGFGTEAFADPNSPGYRPELIHRITADLATGKEIAVEPGIERTHPREAIRAVAEGLKAEGYPDAARRAQGALVTDDRRLAASVVRELATDMQFWPGEKTRDLRADLSRISDALAARTPEIDRAYSLMPAQPQERSFANDLIGAVDYAAFEGQQASGLSWKVYSESPVHRRELKRQVALVAKQYEIDSSDPRLKEFVGRVWDHITADRSEIDALPEGPQRSEAIYTAWQRGIETPAHDAARAFGFAPAQERITAIDRGDGQFDMFRGDLTKADDDRYTGTASAKEIAQAVVRGDNVKIIDREGDSLPAPLGAQRPFSALPGEGQREHSMATTAPQTRDGRGASSITLVGELERDPTVIPNRSGEGEKALVRVRSTTPGYTFTKDGQEMTVEDKTHWHNATIVGKDAVDKVRDMHAGEQIKVQGRVEQYNDGETKRSVLAIRGFDVSQDVTDADRKEPNRVRIAGEITDSKFRPNRGNTQLNSLDYTVRTFGREPQAITVREFGTNVQELSAQRQPGATVEIDGRYSHASFEGRNGRVDSFFISTTPGEVRPLSRNQELNHTQEHDVTQDTFRGDPHPGAGDIPSGQKLETQRNHEFDRDMGKANARSGFEQNGSEPKIGQRVAIQHDAHERDKSLSVGTDKALTHDTGRGTGLVD